MILSYRQSTRYVPRITVLDTRYQYLVPGTLVPGYRTHLTTSVSFIAAAISYHTLCSGYYQVPEADNYTTHDAIFVTASSSFQSLYLVQGGTQTMCWRHDDAVAKYDHDWWRMRCLILWYQVPVAYLLWYLVLGPRCLIPWYQVPGYQCVRPARSCGNFASSCTCSQNRQIIPRQRPWGPFFPFFPK